MSSHDGFPNDGGILTDFPRTRRIAATTAPLLLGLIEKHASVRPDDQLRVMRCANQFPIAVRQFAWWRRIELNQEQGKKYVYIYIRKEQNPQFLLSMYGGN